MTTFRVLYIIRNAITIKTVILCKCKNNMCIMENMRDSDGKSVVRNIR